MTLMRVRRAAQLTLPAEIRRALHVKDGDYLEAKVVKNGVLLKPVAITDRERAWQRIEAAASKVRDLHPDPKEDTIEAEEWIAREIKAMRRKHAS